jgi:hypothetical protein
MSTVGRWVVWQRRSASRLLLAIVVAGCLGTVSHAQGVAPQVAFDKTKGTGVFTALAKYSFEAFKRGDLGNAKDFAKMIEPIWNAGYGRYGDTQLCSYNLAVYLELDRAMDRYIDSLTEFKGDVPDPIQVESAYNTYMAKLALIEPYLREVDRLEDEFWDKRAFASKLIPPGFLTPKKTDKK